MYLQKQKTKVALIRGIIVTGVITLGLASTSHAAILFQNDSFEVVESEGIILDALDQATGDIIIQFGGTLNETIRWSAANTRFEVSDDFDLTNHQLTTARIENLSVLPGGAGGLGAGGIGRIVQLTATDSVAPGCASSPNCPAGTYTWDGAAWRLLSSTATTGFAQTVTVAKSGGDFTSIKAAVDSITDNSAAKPYVVLVYPGVYDEDPITMKSYVNIFSEGGAQVTKINANTATTDLVTMASESQLGGFRLDGVTTGACVRAASVTNTIIFDSIVEDCEYGIRATASATLIRGLKQSVGTMTHLISSEAASLVTVTGAYVDGGTLTSVFRAVDAGTVLIVGSSASVSSSVTNGFFADNGATIRVAGSLINGSTNAIHIGSTGSGTRIESSGSVIANSGAYDILVDDNDAQIVISGGVVDRNKISIPPGNQISILFSDETNENRGTVLLGEFSAGSPENPTEANFGEGDNYTNGMLVYTFDGVTYSDVTSAAQSISGSTFSFPGTGADNAIYISTDRKDTSGDVTQFSGYKVFSSSTPLTLGGGSIVHEYWNGSAWVAFDIMCAHELLFYPYNSDCFLRPNTREQVRFDERIKSSWVKNDPPATGTNRYWTRIRIASPVTTVPVFEQFKIHTNRLEIGADGTLTFFGRGRYRETFVVSPETIFFGAGSNVPDNIAFSVGSGSTWSDERNKAAFTGVGSVIEEITGSIALPHGIDTSDELRANIYWKKADSGSGNVQWKIDYITARAKNVPVADGTNVTPAPRAVGDTITAIVTQTIETTPEGTGATGGEIIFSKFAPGVDISGYYEGDTFFVRLYRDPADPDDTYAGDAILTGFEIDGAFWKLGDNNR